MKKKLFLVIAMVTLLVCLFAISVNAARVENYDDTFTLQSQVNIAHFEKWLYNDGKSSVRKGYTDSVTVSFVDENGNPLTEVAMWEYDEAEDKYYSLVWYISDYELTWEDQTYTDSNVGTQTYPKYTSAVYTLTSVRAVDLRYYTYSVNKSFSTVESWATARSLTALKGVYYDVNNTPDDTSDDLKLHDTIGIGRDSDNQGYFGYEAQWTATGNKIVVANFRDCDFQCDVNANYGFSNTWTRADNLQCLWYPDTMLYIDGNIGSVYEVDFGDGMEIINCQILRDNKKVKEVKIPNSTLFLSNEAFRGSDLTTLIVGEGLLAHGASPFLYTGGADNVYLSKNLLKESYTGTVTSLIANTSATIYFDGNLEEATAFMEKIIAASSSYNGKITLVDYNEQTERGSLKNVVLFYNYNRCDAFYDSTHDHSVNGSFEYNDGFDGAGLITMLCSRCNSLDQNETDPIVSSLGYAVFAPETGRTLVTSGFTVDTALVELYEKFNGVTLEIGVLFVSPETVESEAPTSLDGINHYSDNGTTHATYNYIVRFPSQTDESYDRFLNAEFVAAAYVYDGASYSFCPGGDKDTTVNILDSGFTTTTLARVSNITSHEEHIGEWVFSYASCTEPTSLKRTCTICGVTEVKADKAVAGHLWGSASEGLLSTSYACQREGCGETLTVKYTNITSSASPELTISGDVYGSENIANLINGVWLEDISATVAPKGSGDVVITASLANPVKMNRIYILGNGTVGVTVGVIYEGSSDYAVAGQGSFSESDKEFFVPVDCTKNITSVRITLVAPSAGMDYFKELAFASSQSNPTEDKDYIISFNPGIGYFESQLDCQEATQGGVLSALPTPKHDSADYTFGGWYKDEELTLEASLDDVYSADTTLYAKWIERILCTDGTTNHAPGEWTVTTPSTCIENGVESAVCQTCGKTITRSSDLADHTETTIPGVPPNCVESGLTDEIVCAVCGIHLGGNEVIPPSGEHVYNESDWVTTLLPTKYTTGLATNTCVGCQTAQEKVLPYTATPEQLDELGIDVKYTGGKYVNETFVDVSALGRAFATSFFTGTSPSYIIDKSLATYWSADTYADGADYTSDYIELELPDVYDIGIIKLNLPNYSAWELGEECYVSFDIEYYDAQSSRWIYIDTVSDKDASTDASTCTVTLTLDAPVTTQKIRASVTHASRYAPATIYELDVFAKAQSSDYAVNSVADSASVSISGKYNDWVSGAETLTDNKLDTYWTTDIRNGGPTWALLEFSEETYIACLQFVVNGAESRSFQVEVYENGNWLPIGDVLMTSQTVGGNVISSNDGVCTFSVDVDKLVTQIKITLTYDAAYWTSYVYEIIPYTVVYATQDPATTECKHEALTQGSTVAPTCTETGYTVMTCSACGAQTKSLATDAKGHSFGSYTVNTEATVNTIGTKVATCTSCSAVNTVAYAYGYEAPVITPYLHNAPAAWAMTFDDGNYSSTYAWVAPQLEKYGFKATALLSVTFSDSLVTEWNRYFDRGVFDLGSHSYNHTSNYSGNVNSSALLSDVINAQYWLRANYKGQKVLTFAAPNGATSSAVAQYLAGPLVANRNGGQGSRFYNIISDLANGRSAWGNLNSYVSKYDQTEGDYIFSNADGSSVYVLNASGSYVVSDSYANTGINYVFDETTMSFVNKGYSAGTYRYDSVNYKYNFQETGSYNLVSGKFVFVNDNSGTYRLLKATIGSYESAIDTLVSNNGFTVECIHALLESRTSVSGTIHASYVSTISKFEHLTRRGVWVPSYNELVMYLKEAQNANVELVNRTATSITVSVTDTLDNYMFDQALTLKVDIDDSWNTITVTQNGVEIPLVSMDEYKQSKNMSSVSCAVDNGYIYIDVIPDGGDIVIIGSTATITENGSSGAEIGTSLKDLLG